jgi:hypothetical protein
MLNYASKLNLTIISLVLLDLLTSQLSLFAALYDTAEPSAFDGSLTAFQVLQTNLESWKKLRMSLFWISFTIRVLFVNELFARIILTQDRKTMVTNPWQVLDMIIILVLVPFKFVFSAQNSLVINFIVIFRLWRIYLILKSYNIHLIGAGEQKVRDVESMSKDLDERCQRLTDALSIAERKMSIMLGDANIGIDLDPLERQKSFKRMSEKEIVVKKSEDSNL